MPIPYPPGKPLTCEQIREVDVLAIEHVGIPGLVLMENAGRGVANFIYDALVNPRRARVLILCGPGNNGGDGFVVARHLRNAGVQVATALAVPREKTKGDAAANLRVYENVGEPLIDAFEPDGLEKTRQEADRADVIVDGLLGTGSKGAPRGTIAELIKLANAAPRARRVAIDIPSGLDGDSGEAAQPCFRADATVTFVAAKVGCTKPAADPFVGRIIVVDIGVPRELIPGREESSGRG
jgi:NAD(P)H-hydrate epimerase